MIKSCLSLTAVFTLSMASIACQPEKPVLQEPFVASAVQSQCTSAHGEPAEAAPKNSQSGIVNGRVISVKDPLVAGLVLIRPNVDGVRAHCTGSLLPGGIILTAAHCIQGDIKKMTVVLPSPTSCSGDVRSVKAVSVHPQSKKSNGGTNRPHDLALIQISGRSNAQGDTFLLASSKLILNPQDTLFMAGFGVTDFNKEDSGDLRVTTQKASKMGRIDGADVYMMDQKESGVCSGDSGGPLVIYRNSVPVIIGVASGVLNPGSDDSSELCRGYSMYTPIETNREWIRKAYQRLVGTKLQP